jgi:Rrf2 family nitric oxide-sensitive transcriptional repressor
MQLSWHTDYGLRTLMFLAGSGKRDTAATIASFFGISKDHVAKIVQRLSKAGFCRSIRGKGGGLELARSPEQISVGDVITLLEGNTHMLECVASEQTICCIQDRCRLRGVLHKAEQLQMDYLRNVTLADIVQPGRHLEQLSA